MTGGGLRRRGFLAAADAFTLGWTVPGGVLRAQGATPAVVNAVFAATGKRIRSLPSRLHDLSKA